MSISPDQSNFTNCVIGEATPAEQSAFNAALLKNAALREEAVTISRTAHRLATALKREEIMCLTNPQRQGVLQYDATQAPDVVRARVRRPWVGRTLATAGMAAVIGLGLYANPSTRPPAGSSSAEAGIPSVSIQPGMVPKTGSRPLTLPPTVAKEVPGIAMPDAAPPESPRRSERRNVIAATPPLIRINPATAPPAPSQEKDFSSPRRPLPVKIIPVESLASPPVQKP